MVITDSVYKMVINFSNKIARSTDKQSKEELQQEVFEKLHKWQEPIEFESSFIYKTIRNTYASKITTSKNRSRLNILYGFECEKAIKPNLRSEAIIDLNFILESFKDLPVQYKTLKFMIDNPDMPIDYMGEAMGVNQNTFKANVKHIKNKIKNEGWL